MYLLVLSSPMDNVFAFCFHRKILLRLELLINFSLVVPFYPLYGIRIFTLENLSRINLFYLKRVLISIETMQS